jgi:siroheme synthase-like protein
MTPLADRAYFAAFLDLRDRAAVVVGGGEIGEGKVEALLRSGARVTVVSPFLAERLAQWSRSGVIAHVAKRFAPQDLAGAAIAIAATDDPVANAAVAKAARSRGIPVNVADDASQSTFIMPAVIDRGPVQIAVSTGGASPTSMAIDRRGIAWVRHTDGAIWKVDTRDLSCTPTSFAPPSDGSFHKFGMGFATASKGASAEELFLPDRAEPVVLPATSPALYLVQRLRDEAHRFAITYHRDLRARRSVRSAFDDLPGVGPKRKRELLKVFGSIKRVRDAPVEQIAAVPGIGPALAARIKATLEA